jgi:hypothetical protein
LASITPGIESNPGKENAGIITPSPLLTNDWFSIGRVERSSRMGGKFDPERFGIPTVSGSGWFPYFRLYGPQQPFFAKTWKLPDLEKMI